MKTIGKVIKTIFNVAITVFVLLFLLIVCLQRFSDNQITFLGYRMFSVASSSMAPDYNIGDVLVVKKTAPEDIKVGDSISYYGKVGSFAGKVITHQVIKIDKDIENNLIFHTKGISNLVEDPLVYADQIYGVVVHKDVVLSFIYRTVNTKYGMFIFIIIPVFYIIGSEMLAFMLEKEEERREKYEKKIKEKEEQKQDEQEDKKEKEEPAKKKSSKKTTKKSTKKTAKKKDEE